MRASPRTGLLLAALALSACRGSLPDPETPLTLTPAGALPAPPAAPAAVPPRYPRPQVHVAANGATLWALPGEGDEVEVSLATRRGDDGGCVRGLLHFALDWTRPGIRSTVPAADPQVRASIHGASLTVRTAKVDAGLSLVEAAIREPGYRRRWVENAVTRRRSELERSKNDAVAAGWMAALEHLERDGFDVGEAHRPWVNRLRSYSLRSMRLCLRERFSPEDLVVIVAGPTTLEEATPIFERLFGRWTPVERAAARPIRQASPSRAVLSEATRDVRTRVLMVQPALPPGHELRPAFEVIVELLGGTFTSVLNGSLREQHAYTYGANAGIDDSTYRDVVLVRAEFEPELVLEALSELFVQLRTLRERPVSAESVALGRARVWTRLRWRIADAPVGLLQDVWMAGLTPEVAEARYASLATLDPAGLQALARRSLRPARSLLVVTGNFAPVAGYLITRERDGFRITED